MSTAGSRLAYIKELLWLLPLLWIIEKLLRYKRLVTRHNSPFCVNILIDTISVHSVSLLNRGLCQLARGVFDANLRAIG